MVSWPSLTVFTLLCLCSSSIHASQGLSTLSLTAQKGATRRYNQRLTKVNGTSVSIPLADDFRGTDLQWFGNLSVGTPPQPLPVVWDTGSSTPEFASTLCADCIHQIRFNASQSSTFVDLNATSTIVFATGGDTLPVVGNNWELTLREGKDTITIGNFKIADVELFQVTNQTAAFDVNPYSGIVGLGSDGSGLFGSLISQGLSSLFGFFLSPEAVGNAELTLGGIDTSKFNSKMTFASLAPNSQEFGDWEILSSGIAVNGKTTSLLHTNRSVIFDTGTSNVLFSTNTTEAIYALISPNIKPNPNFPGAYGIPCSMISDLPAQIDITFTSTERHPFILTIPSEELNVGPFPDNATLCQTLINAFDGIELVGGSLFKHYYTVWDVGNQQMGFAPV